MKIYIEDNIIINLFNNIKMSSPISLNTIRTSFNEVKPIRFSSYYKYTFPAITPNNAISLRYIYSNNNVYNINTFTYDYTNSIIPITIPSNVNSILVYCWGAGAGGNGGFVKVNINTSSIKSLALIVGQGGYIGYGNRTFGGGGAGGTYYYYDNYNTIIRSGGGLSGIFINNASMTITNNIINSAATPIIIAGGGGGHGSYITNYNGTDYKGTPYGGGHGGSTTGNDGTYFYINAVSFNPAVRGTGGTQISGGNGGIGIDAYGNPMYNENGNKFYGGNITNWFGPTIINSEFVGAGGGGYYGGGSGGYKDGLSAGGGGGSSYINPTYVTTTYNNDKSTNNNPPGFNEIYYKSGIATNNGNGYIVIKYQ